MTSTTPISGIGVVSVVINIADVNDNAPVILNDLADPLSIPEVIYQFKPRLMMLLCIVFCLFVYLCAISLAWLAQ